LTDAPKYHFATFCSECQVIAIWREPDRARAYISVKISDRRREFQDIKINNGKCFFVSGHCQQVFIGIQIKNCIFEVKLLYRCTVCGFPDVYGFIGTARDQVFSIRAEYRVVYIFIMLNAIN
jgi:hypothetical protein